MDFTLKTYIRLLKTLKSHNYTFLPFSDYIQLYNQSTSPIHPPSTSPSLPIIILRHDVDKLPQNALRFAQIEYRLCIRGTYYFRIVPQSFNPVIIEKIAGLGHEIGYHYEDIDFAAQNHKIKDKRKKIKIEDLCSLAIESFQKNLETLRKIAPVKTICMHGSPLSKFDNKLLWKYYNYKDFGIIGEPYFEVDFLKVLYLTDTGRRWNGGKFSIRDKGLGIRKQELGYPYQDWVVKPKVGSLMRMTEKGIEFQSKYNFRSTNDIIRAAENGELPDKIMMTFHPQRWTDKVVPWVKELVWQNVKNVGKWVLIRIRQ